MKDIEKNNNDLDKNEKLSSENWIPEDLARLQKDIHSDHKEVQEDDDPIEQDSNKINAFDELKNQEELEVISTGRESLANLKKEILESLEKKKHEQVDEKWKQNTVHKKPYTPSERFEENDIYQAAQLGRHEARKRPERLASNLINRVEKRFNIKVPWFIKDTLTT